MKIGKLFWLTPTLYKNTKYRILLRQKIEENILLKYEQQKRIAIKPHREISKEHDENEVLNINIYKNHTRKKVIIQHFKL